MSDGDRRHTIAQPANLISDAMSRAEAEARNGLLQFDFGCHAILDALGKAPDWKMRPSLVLALHREALQGISAYAGTYRPSAVSIGGSRHEPIEAALVAEQMEFMCDYINMNWESKSAIHLAACAMWRLNWIHPFSDGNGRTSRMLSYMVLCIKFGLLLPGERTIPDQITENRIPYFEALEAADKNPPDGPYDVSAMEALLERLLAVQLTTGLTRDEDLPIS